MNDYRDGIKIKNEDNPVVNEDIELVGQSALQDECSLIMGDKQTQSTSSTSSLSFTSTTNTSQNANPKSPLVKKDATQSAATKSSVSNFSNPAKSSNATSVNSLSIHSSAVLNNEAGTGVVEVKSQLGEDQDSKNLMLSSLSVDSSSQSAGIDLKVLIIYYKLIF